MQMKGRIPLPSSKKIDLRQRNQVHSVRHTELFAHSNLSEESPNCHREIDDSLLRERAICGTLHSVHHLKIGIARESEEEILH